MKATDLQPPELTQEVFSGAVGERYQKSPNPNFFERLKEEARWFDPLCDSGFMPGQCYMSNGVGTRAQRGLRRGKLRAGINFGSQDYLSLSAHPSIISAVQEVMQSHGVHSAGSAALSGTLDIGLDLERELAEFTGYRDATLFPIGWAAGYGAITALVRPEDHVLVDCLAHACLQEGAMNATSNFHRFSHLSSDSVDRRLTRIRKKSPGSGILVVTETLFSMDSDVPDIAQLQAVCRKHGAFLMVDVAHDLGALGPKGGGFLETQGMWGKVDVVMASFSKSFASTGGMVACNEPGLKARLRYGCGPSTFTNAMTPLQIAVVRKSLEIIRGLEGSLRREKLMDNIMYLRRQFEANDFEVMGEPSAVVPVILGARGRSRVATRLAIEAGAFINLAEYPAVSKSTSRWRLQVMTDHTRGQIDSLVDIAVKARAEALTVVQEEKPEPKQQRSLAHSRSFEASSP